MLREKHQRCVPSVARLVATSLTCWAQQRKLADTKHTDESGWAAAANAGAHLDAALGQQRLAMRAILLAGANPAPSEGNHAERGDYFRTGASFAASISVRANHWPRSVSRAEPCRRFMITENMPSRARSATVTPEMCLPSGVPHQ